MNKFIKNLWYKIIWEYGTCYSISPERPPNTRTARRHRFNRNVQFILWKVGDKQGNYVYTEDYWHDYHKDWWQNFKKNE